MKDKLDGTDAIFAVTWTAVDVDSRNGKNDLHVWFIVCTVKFYSPPQPQQVRAGGWFEVEH